MAEISKNIIEKARQLVKQNRVIKDVENDKRIHFKVLGESEEHIVIYDKLSKRYDCECEWATLKRKLCSHVVGCMILQGEV